MEIFFGPLLLGPLWCYCGDNGDKMLTSFKTLVSKNAEHGVCTKALGNDTFV